MLCSTGATALPLQCPSSFPTKISSKSTRYSTNKSILKSQFPSSFHTLLNNDVPKTTSIQLNCSSNSQSLSSSDQNFPSQDQNQEQGNVGFWGKWKANSAEMSAKLAKMGLAAVLAYGLFDGVTYTSFFVLAFLGYEKSTGNNPAANLQALVGIVIMMWTGNNVTRPFRVAGAAALAPAMDKGLRRIQKALNLPRVVYAFALVVGIVASSCFTVIGVLILSRWGK